MAVAATALFLAACGGDAAQTGENVIETQIEEQLGLGELDASCDQPDDAVEGVEFTCTAATTDGRTVEFLSVFTSDTEIFVQPTNVLAPEQLEFAKQETARILSPELPIELDPTLMDCPDDEVIFLVMSGERFEGYVDCTYPDPQSGEPVPLRMTFSNFVIEQGHQDLAAAIGDSVDN